MWVRKLFKFSFIIILIACSDAKISSDLEQVSVLHLLEDGSVEIVHFRCDSNFVQNALYDAKQQFNRQMGLNEWNVFIDNLDSIGIMNWSDRNIEWSNRPQEFEIRFLFKNHQTIKRVNNGVADKFNSVKSLLTRMEVSK